MNIVVLALYCLANAAIMTGLFSIVQPSISYLRTFQVLLIKIIISVIIVFGFYALLARMFCWTATIAQCLECICPTFTSSSLIEHMNLPATILFFVSVSLVQTTIIAIPRGLSSTTFVALVAASNSISSLLKLGIISFLASYL
ncbi:MAG: hypothetical protein WD055_00595 [Candidatus Dependentiae bacterium]